MTAVPRRSSSQGTRTFQLLCTQERLSVQQQRQAFKLPHAKVQANAAWYEEGHCALLLAIALPIAVGATSAVIPPLYL